MTSFFKLEYSQDGENWSELTGQPKHTTNEAAEDVRNHLANRNPHLNYRVTEVKPVVFKDSRSRVKTSGQRKQGSYPHGSEAEFMWLRGDPEILIEKKVNH